MKVVVEMLVGMCAGCWSLISVPAEVYVESVQEGEMKRKEEK